MVNVILLDSYSSISKKDLAQIVGLTMKTNGRLGKRRAHESHTPMEWIPGLLEKPKISVNGSF